MTLERRTAAQSKKAQPRWLPILTIICLIVCAIAGLAIGVYDIAYTSVNFGQPDVVSKH